MRPDARVEAAARAMWAVEHPAEPWDELPAADEPVKDRYRALAAAADQAAGVAGPEPEALERAGKLEAALRDCVREIRELGDEYTRLRKTYEPPFVGHASWSVGAAYDLIGRDKDAV